MRNRKKDINKKIKELCDIFSFSIEKTEEDYLKIYTGHIEGLTLFLNIDNDKVSFYFLIRTYNVIYQGDRSDIHIVISLMFASFLKIKAKISCSIFDIPHPVVSNEIWGRYIYPMQYQDTYTNNLDFTEELLRVIYEWKFIFWNLIGCPCEECMNEANLMEDNNDNIEPNLINYTTKISQYNLGRRRRPSYSIVYDIDNDITIIKSKSLTEYLKFIITKFEYKPQNISGINGDILIDSFIYNFSNSGALKEIKNVLKSIGYQNDEENNLIIIENFIIDVTSEYVVAKSIDSGIEAFKKEKEIIRKRHNFEASILFPIPTFEWVQNPCPTQFELLIKNLLERDNKVKRVRIAAPTFQGDKGRDLIIDWEVIDENKQFSKETPPTRILKVVGQCKASNKSINKDKVKDIRDTIEYHDATGFFLAVSTQITYPLTEELEKLKQKQYWTDWWNRDDIELRLNQNQDLILKFDKVLKINKSVKFVMKEEQ